MAFSQCLTSLAVLALTSVGFGASPTCFEDENVIDSEILGGLEFDSLHDEKLVSSLGSAGSLVVYAAMGRNLRNLDGWGGKSDPFLTLTAEDGYGSVAATRTRVMKDNANPAWTEYKFFPKSTWRKLCAEILDADDEHIHGDHDIMLPEYCVSDLQRGNWTRVRICDDGDACRSHVKFWYFYK